MKHYSLTIFILLTGFISFSQYNVQSKYFVYLQTEPAQPFYIKINSQQISANSSGYLILPQLKDGNYKLVVGFPQSKYPEQVFNFKIDSKDKGYLIKDFGADGWGLFDLQTMEVQKPLTGNDAIVKNTPAPPVQKPQQNVTPAENVSDFTKALSKAANDPSLLEKPKPEPEKPVVKEQPVTTQSQQQDLVKKESEAVKEQPQPENKPVIKQTEKPKPVLTVTKIEQNTTTEGITAVYKDQGEKGNTETISIFIPAVEQAAPPVQENVSSAQVANNNETTASDNNFTVQEKPVVEEKPQVINDVPPMAIPDNCKKVATEDDFLKLRRDMASRQNDDDMITEAKKAFKGKCYTTSQIKYLSSMFLSNAGKYNFYASAYTHVADPEKFSTLRDEIKDPYYLGKFDGLINK